MHAQVGDGLVIQGHQVGQSRRTGEIVEVRGAAGAPRYLVRWDDSGRTTLLFPCSDCEIHHPTSNGDSC